MRQLETDLAKATLDGLDIGLIVLTDDHRVLSWNSWMTSASGVELDAAEGRTLAEIFPNARLHRLRSAVQQALDSGASSLLTHSLHRDLFPLKTRTARPMVYNVAVRPIGDKPYQRCIVQISDVTLASERERVLRERQNARYDAVVASAPDAIITFDAEGSVQLANPAAARQFGFDAAEMTGRSIDTLLGEDEAWTAGWRTMVAGGSVHWPLELAVRRKDGSTTFVDASASLWVSGSRAFLTAIFRDVNERRDAEAKLRRLNETLEERVSERTADLERLHEQLRQSQKMEAVGQLTGGIAHDFNNLLTPILGGLDILQRRGVGDERGQRLIDGALQSAERARVLVQRLLAFARRQPLQASAVDIRNIVAEMSDLIGGTLGPSIRIVLDIAKDMPPAMADPNQLEMALLNLAVNARDAMADGGILTISARAAEVGAGRKLAPGRYIRLAVSDTGSGMDAQVLARAVEPFFSTKGIGKGTGLGLSMIHGLAAQLGGTLELASTVGVGTTVEMWIPEAKSDAVAAPIREAEGELAAGVGTVLLVDDEEVIRTTTAQMLADMGYAVIEASSANEALSHLGDSRIELLITDHLMPGMSGTELAREAQSQRPGLPILIISGFAEVEDIAPDLPRLMKPFRAVELAAGLASLAPPER
ncbi:PAS domain-containing sensor histidine kinase [Phenylobacterium sp.]|uniref:hybrid sensor histidine kinase/response regulator n=1 Tax=Phenylobacterium sp. TaxID=1871053 RepID=UPI0012231575|nr:PAS domain-containing sensor histidine kinase [Phenylobacterium sp.]THD62580.1 MAG: PAS domain-containing sensor histidine kinase [Phenylobacterium sp.]